MTDVKTSPVYTDENGQRYHLERVRGEKFEDWPGPFIIRDGRQATNVVKDTGYSVFPCRYHLQDSFNRWATIIGKSPDGPEYDIFPARRVYKRNRNFDEVHKGTVIAFDNPHGPCCEDEKPGQPLTVIFGSSGERRFVRPYSSKRSCSIRGGYDLWTDWGGYIVSQPEDEPEGEADGEIPYPAAIEPQNEPQEDTDWRQQKAPARMRPWYPGYEGPVFTRRGNPAKILTEDYLGARRAIIIQEYIPDSRRDIVGVLDKDGGMNATSKDDDSTLMIPDPIRECWSVEYRGKTTFRTTNPETVPEGAIVRRFVEVDEAWEP